MRKLVITPDNTIYWATVNEKNNTINENTKVDVTDNALEVVLEHLTNLDGFKGEGFAGYELPVVYDENTAILCAFRSDKVTYITREKYDELLEYKAMYENLCK